MNTYEEVSAMISEWQTMGLSKEERVVLIAEACMGWPYVWGGYGQKCTKANREAYANRGTCPSAESDIIRKRCQRLRNTSPKDTCNGCKWYPGGVTLFFDCRGFTRWVLARVGISLQGGGATSQWKNDANWTAKGKIADMPEDKICCVFMQQGNTMSHTGLYVGGGRIIHCSGEVKEGKPTDKGWTHYAIPKGLEGDIPVPTPTPPTPSPTHKTIRKGSTGPDVVECQEDLIYLGYDLQPYGADGKFGAKTEAAVKSFQSTHVGPDGKKLVADGVVGKNTWWALDEAVKEKPQPEPTEILYTVTIKHVTKETAEEITKQYGGTMTEERGENNG